MKKLLLAVSLVWVIAAVSCVKVNFDDGDDTGGGGTIDPNSNVITGVISSSKFYAKGKWILKGYVYVTNGATVTFEAGCIIQSDVTEKGALIIERGAKLIAQGTAGNPIVFTSGKPVGSRAPGDWGGIILLGKAPTNRPLDPAPTIEGGVGRQYGGTDPLDESGILRYVRIEFAGIAAEPGSEINGLTLGGVGSGTIIENVQVSYGNDDAYEFFGGTVNAKNLVAFATADDDFDFDFGYTGKIQFAVSCRKPDFVDAGDAGNGVECDNDATGTLATPRTRPQLSNFTIVGPNDAVGTAANHNYSLRWRRATQFVMRNSVIIGHPDAGFSMESDATLNDYYVNNISEFKNNLIFATANTYRSGNAAIATATQVQTKAEADGCVTLANTAAAQLTSPFFSITPNFLPATGSPALAGASFTGMNAFFTTTAYRGAFGTTNWTSGWCNWDPQNTVY
ncbi:MAG: T9SS C-terminal target domain-containing protein [Chitinophagaceae bacterium]|nr:T9SS C-terminal target domain-containing protein [Chitinophagaceae bacterium]